MSRSPRFLLDEHIDPRVATILRSQGIDTVAVAGSARRGMDDLELFRIAVEERRIVVTCDTPDFISALRELLKEGVAVPGLVFVSRRSYPAEAFVRLSHALRRLSRQIARGEVNPTGGVYLTSTRGSPS